MKIGLALGSGSARGLTHIGVLKALEEKNIKIDYISGSSIGALIGGAYAMGMSVAEIEDIALQTDWKLMARLMSPTFSMSALLNDSYLREFLSTYFKDKTFEDLKIPFSAIATDIETGDMVVLNSGELLTAIRASISIPIVLSPVIYKNHKLVDGGLVNPIPVDVVREHNVDKIIAVNLINTAPTKPELKVEIDTKDLKDDLSNLSLNQKLEYFIKHPIDYFNDKKVTKSIESPHFGKIIYQALLIVQVQMAKLTMRVVKPDILIQPETSSYTLFDFSKGKELIDIGYKCAMEELNKNDSLLR
ncbi:MAG: patatin [Ignavibacteriae bacterium]|jgi:NTE family protein|nr:patatin [Ignavibacteriota bacterium]